MVGIMSMSQRLRELIAEFAEVQANPITDGALVDRMSTEATRWVNAVHMQCRRVSEPLVDANNPGEEIWRQEIDLHFLLVALTRLRRAVGITTRVDQLQATLVNRIIEFDDRVPYLSRLRNVAEHFDDYTVGRGRDTRVMRFELQRWSMDRDPDGHLIWIWLGERLQIAEAHSAAKLLYQGFITDIERYVADLAQRSLDE